MRTDEKKAANEGGTTGKKRTAPSNCPIFPSRARVIPPPFGPPTRPGLRARIITRRPRKLLYFTLRVTSAVPVARVLSPVNLSVASDPRNLCGPHKSRRRRRATSRIKPLATTILQHTRARVLYTYDLSPCPRTSIGEVIFSSIPFFFDTIAPISSLVPLAYTAVTF